MKAVFFGNLTLSSYTLKSFEEFLLGFVYSQGRDRGYQFPPENQLFRGER